MLRSITIPAPIQFDDAKVPARVYYRHVLGTDRRFNADRAGARIAKRIDAALEETGDRVLLAEADWEKLKEAIETPKPIDGAHPFPTRHAYKYVPCMDAVIDATEEKPGALVPTEDAPKKSNGKAKTAEA